MKAGFGHNCRQQIGTGQNQLQLSWCTMTGPTRRLNITLYRKDVLLLCKLAGYFKHRYRSLLNKCFLNIRRISVMKKNQIYRCLLEKTAEVLAATGRPGEDTVVTGQRGRHDVALWLFAHVSFAVMHHSEAGGFKKKEIEHRMYRWIECTAYNMHIRKIKL